MRPDPGLDTAAQVDTLLADGVPGRSRPVPADPERHLVAPAEAARRLGRPLIDGRLDYTFDIGPALRAIVLDTVNRAGGSRGQLTAPQLAWLRAELRRVDQRYVVVFTHNPLESTDGGEKAFAALDATPRVVAVVAGNRHRNTIEPRPEGPYWLIGTASLADFPMQARMFRLVRTDRGVALETWMVDQDGRGLADVARELAFLDAQGGRPLGYAGRPRDRNARLDLP